MSCPDCGKWFCQCQAGLFDGPPRARNTDPDVERLRRIAKEPLTICECCGRASKVYRRKLNSGMALAICWWLVRHGNQFAHISDGDSSVVLRRGGDFAKLELWGLIEQQPNNDPTKKHSGVWHLTELGERFARNECRVPSHVFVQPPRNNLLGVEQTTTDIVEALGGHFNYPELMRGGDVKPKTRSIT